MSKKDEKLRFILNTETGAATTGAETQPKPQIKKKKQEPTEVEELT